MLHLRFGGAYFFGGRGLSLVSDLTVSSDHLFIAGLRITSDVLIGKSTWDVLFQPPNFFSKYKYLISSCFLCLNVTLSLSYPAGLYHLNVSLRIVAIKILYFGSVVFDWWSVLANNTCLNKDGDIEIIYLQQKLNQHFLVLVLNTKYYWFFLFYKQNNSKVLTNKFWLWKEKNIFNDWTLLFALHH